MEAVIYAAEEPVTLLQLRGLLGQEAQAELDAVDARQGQLSLLTAGDSVTEAGDDQDALNAETLGESASRDPASQDPGSLNPSGLEPASLDTDSSNSDGVDPAGYGQAELVQGQEASSAGAANDQAETSSNADPTAPPQGPSPERAGHDTAEAELPAAEQRARERRLRDYVRSRLDELIAEYAEGDRGLEVREVAGGFRMATKPEYHDAVRGFVRSLKPPLKLTLQALETLAVVAYKQPVTAPEVSEIRGVDSAGALGSLLGRRLVSTLR